jgi:hypothetical protein
MSNESREETVESLRAALDVKHRRVMELSDAIPAIPEGGFTDEEAERYLSMNRRIIEELEEMENIYARIDATWASIIPLSSSPISAALRQAVDSHVEARYAQLEEWLTEQRNQNRVAEQDAATAESTAGPEPAPTASPESAA